MLMSLCVAIPLCCVPVPFPLRSVAVNSVHSLRRVPIALRSRSVAFHSFAFRCAPVASRFDTFICVPFRCVPVALRSFLLHSRSVLLRCAARPCVRTCVPLNSIAFQLRSVAVHCVLVAFHSVVFPCAPFRSRCFPVALRSRYVAFPFRSVPFCCIFLRSRFVSFRPVSFCCFPLRCVPVMLRFHCVPLCMRVCVRSCVLACVRACLRACLLA